MTMEKDFVSFVVVHYNNFEFLKRCVTSLFAHMDLEQGQYEVIVVDNAATDNACDWVEENIPGVRIVRSKSNRGFAGGANLGIGAARGNVVALVNNDLEFCEQTSFAKMLEVFAHVEKTGIVCAQLLNSDQSAQSSYYFLPSLFTELTNKSLIGKSGFARGKKVWQNCLEVPAAVGAFLMISKAALDDAGWLDEDFFFFMEETDMCLRFAKKGWKIVFCPDSRIVHHQGKTANKRPSRARIEYYRSRYLYFKKHHTKTAKTALFAGVFMRLAVNTLSYTLINVFSLFCVEKIRNKWLVYCKVFCWHICGCPRKWGLVSGK